MVAIRVPRDQVETVLTQRIRAGDDLVTQAEIAENAGGYRDWIYLFSTWRDHTLAELRAVYEGEEIPREFEAVTMSGDHSTPRYTFPYRKSALETGLRWLRDLVARLALAVEPETPGPPRTESEAHRKQDARTTRGPDVFIVHGRAAGGFLDGAARFIEQLALRPVILAEQANEGRTLIEKFETYAEVDYAIVLLTPEDFAYDAGDEPPPQPNRARQNVILEVGYFMGKLGRPNVVALLQEGVEVPSDILGIAYLPLDDGDAWKTLLARELIAAGFEIDPTRLMG